MSRKSAFCCLLGICLLAQPWAIAKGQLVLVNNLPGTFIDISTTGTPLGLAGDLEATIVSTVSNAVFPAGNVIVGNNGGIAFGMPPSSDLGPDNEPLPSLEAFGNGQSLLPLWDDMGNTVGEVFWTIQRSSLIVQWNQKRFEGGTDSTTYQIQVFNGVPYPPLGGIYAQFIYVDVEQPRAGGGASATIGYQDGGTGYNDVQWSFNTAGAVSNGTVLSLIPEPSTLGLLCGTLLTLGPRRRPRR